MGNYKLKKIVQNMRRIISDNPLTLDGETFKEKLSEKYLGDHIHSEGLAKSAALTVEKRYWPTVSASLEIRTILEDYRVNVCGGANTGITIFESAVIPMLFNSSETWDQIDEATVQKLDKLQNKVIQYIFCTPRSTPQPILNWDSGMLPAFYRILQKKLNFLFHLSQLDDESLAKETLDVQEKYNFPGLSTEMKPWLKQFGLESYVENKEPKISKASFSKKVKENIIAVCEKELLEKMKSYKKLTQGPIFNGDVEETFGKKPYINQLPLANARETFKFRSKMYDVAFNYKHQGNNAENLWKCTSCQSAIESQDHVLFCPAYAQLREGKSLDSDKDLSDYLMKVLIIREKLKISK